MRLDKNKCIYLAHQAMDDNQKNGMSKPKPLADTIALSFKTRTNVTKDEKKIGVASRRIPPHVNLCRIANGVIPFNLCWLTAKLPRKG